YYSYRYFFDLTMRARANRNSIIFAGTMGLLRRSALLEVGGWSEECVTEDAEASLRILGRGYSGAYVPQAWGSGLMPLDFDGLKKQRYRWSLGGIQILKEHWRELIPGIPHRMKLTFAQRMHYLFGSLQWFGDPLTAGFTILLAGTALGIAARHRLPVRQLTGPAMVVPMIFLATGLLRALWALKVTTKSTWGDALRALRIWFALSWVVTMACIAGLFRSEAVFLRTPKRKDGKLSVLQALRSSWIETGFVALTLISGALMLLVEPTFAFAALAAMLLFEAFVYGSAPWASLAAEGIILTPLREAQKRSAQNTGMRPALRRAAAVPAGIAAAAATAVMASVVVVAPTGAPPSTHDLPTFGQVVGAAPNNPVTPVLEVSPSVPIGLPVQNVDATPVPSASASVAPSALPSASASPSTVPSAAPSPPPSPVPSASAQPLP
ncbi:MAG: hypothetical protein QOE92_751, partial [Chloroflexota bacterium]|nr:hypothetical protein [Chloroflexota bacterium]